MTENAPEGALTLVFTDVQGSTSLWERDTTAMRAALAIHNDALRKLLAQHHGYEVKTEGDAFMVAFASAANAVAWALNIQTTLLQHAWPPTLADQAEAAEEQDSSGQWRFRGLRVRVGIHHGTPERVINPTTKRNDYLGRMVNCASRISSAAHGGQVIISEAAWDAAQRTVSGTGSGIIRKDLGDHRLKGLDYAVRLFEISSAALPARSFPRLNTVDLRRTNLPKESARFVGRERELKALEEMFTTGGARLVTLSGPGGIGKSRLARQYAASSLARYAEAGGAWYCELADARSVAELCHNVAAALKIPLALNATDTQAVEQLGAAMSASGDLLLICDAFESLGETGAVVLRRWLEVAPDLDVLVTAHHILRLPLEIELPLESLGTRVRADTAASEAVQLFVERAKAKKGWQYEPSPSDLEVITQLVVRLHGLPLAIELVAARVGILSPAQLLKRLTTSLDKLSPDPRHAQDAQATLRGTIAWAWELLSGYERRALMQLAVFRGGFSFDAAEQVVDCGPDAGFVLDHLQTLREKALLREHHGAADGGELRLGMFDAIHEFAESRIAESSLLAETRSRYVRYFAGFGKGWRLVANNEQGAQAMKAIELETLNLRSALSSARDATPSHIEANDLVLELALALACVLSVKGPLSELITLLTPVATLPYSSLELLAAANLELGRAHGLVGAATASEDALDRAITCSMDAKNGRMVGKAQVEKAILKMNTGDLDTARDLLDKAAAQAEPDSWLEAFVLANRGCLAFFAGRTSDALEPMRLAFDAFVRLKDKRYACVIGINNAALQAELGNNNEALALMSQALPLTLEVDDLESKVILLLNFAMIALDQNDLETAERHGQSALAKLREVGLPQDNALSILAKIAWARGDLKRARELFLQQCENSASGRLKEIACAAVAALDPLLGLTSGAVASTAMSQDPATLFQLSALAAISRVARREANAGEALRALIANTSERLVGSNADVRLFLGLLRKTAAAVP